MTTDYDLGELTFVAAREIWRHEANEFTPWLACPDRIAQLGVALGLELEVEDTEVGVGPYSADVLARDTATGNYVVIENQIDKFDHDHLGKAIVYAATLDAGTIVWIATDFTEEHRRAIDWLNDNSTGDLAYFGVRIEVWRIGASKPAPRFNVLSRPADTRPGIVRPTGFLSETRKLQLEWWTHFRDALQQAGIVPSVRSPHPRYWYDVSLGRSGFVLSCIADTNADRIGVRLYMRNKYGGTMALHRLLDEKDAIEAEIGHALVWDANPEASDKTVASTREGSLEDRDRWPEYADWLVREVGVFRKVFSPRLKGMDLRPAEDESDEGEEGV